VKEIQKKET